MDIKATYDGMDNDGMTSAMTSYLPINVLLILCGSSNFPSPTSLITAENVHLDNAWIGAEMAEKAPSLSGETEGRAALEAG
ncbi:hypothetical protein J6590_053917 [Homalodisca vitripennis]|nr:hypothetical protein J6590_053917 [Homalodisca vitripennis]